MEVTLVVGREIAGLQATLAVVRGLLVGVGILAVMLSAGVLAWVVRRSLGPIDRLGAQIAKVGEDDLSARIDAAGIPQELAPVVGRLNDLLARLEAAFQRERRFTGNVAHEMRTPLAGLRSKLELALSRDRAPEAYREALGDCLDIDLQMQGMVENLLHLARADAGQLEVRREPVDLAEVFQKCWEPLGARARRRGLSVEWCLNVPGTVETDRDQLRLVLQNILDNAVGHANDRGSIRVAARADRDVAVLTVSNTGSILSADEVHHVFDRFWRGDASCRDAGDSRCGLGLPLCKTIIEQLDGAIEATTSADGKFTISIRLPHAGTGASSPQGTGRGGGRSSNGLTPLRGHRR
jgi:two-component system sensor histidine kinase QseC